MININTKKFNFPQSFFTLSKNIYSDNPLFDNQKELSVLFSEWNPYFIKNEAAYKVIKGKARVTTFFDENLLYKDEHIAYFGYWESENDEQVNENIFSECEKWAKDRGAKYLIGPIDFNTYNKYRLNLTKNDPLPFFNEPMNPSYYPELLTACGFKVLNSYVSYIINSKQKIENWYNTYNDKKDLLDFKEYSFEFINPKNWMSRLKEIHEKSKMVFGDNFAYSAIDFQSFQVKYGEIFSKLICQKTSIWAIDRNDKIVGAIVNFPDYLPALKSGNTLQELNSEEYIDSTIKPTLLVKTAGVLKEHSHMGFLLISMLLKIIPNALKHYDKYILCLMEDGNYPSKIGKEFSDFTKQYALYIKTI